MLEKSEKFNSNHYVINSNNFDNILNFEAGLLKLSEYSDYEFNSFFEKLLENVGEQFKLTDNITSELNAIVFEGYQDNLDYPWDEIENIKNKL